MKFHLISKDQYQEFLGLDQRDNIDEKLNNYSQAYKKELNGQKKQLQILPQQNRFSNIFKRQKSSYELNTNQKLKIDESKQNLQNSICKNDTQLLEKEFNKLVTEGFSALSLMRSEQNSYCKDQLTDRILKIFGIQKNHLSQLRSQQDKSSYITNQMNETVKNLLNQFDAKIEQKERAQQQEDSLINQRISEMYDKSIEINKITENSKYKLLSNRLNEMIAKQMDQFQISHDNNDWQKKIEGTIKWNQNAEKGYKSRKQLFNINQKSKRINLNNSYFFENIHSLLQNQKQQDNRVDLTEKFKLQGQEMNEKEIKYLVDQSQLFYGIYSKDYLNSIDQQTLNQMETQLADQILETYQYLLDIIKKERQTYLIERTSLRNSRSRGILQNDKSILFRNKQSLEHSISRINLSRQASSFIQITPFQEHTQIRSQVPTRRRVVSMLQPKQISLSRQSSKCQHTKSQFQQIYSGGPTIFDPHDYDQFKKQEKNAIIIQRNVRLFLFRQKLKKLRKNRLQMTNKLRNQTLKSQQSTNLLQSCQLIENKKTSTDSVILRGTASRVQSLLKVRLIRCESTKVRELNNSQKELQNKLSRQENNRPKILS